ncbi:hypothetical protein FOL47_002795 [Perkinsus chesapeaki]|uniref:Peptidase A1 domain-containing protein n=1 Tax=Perkinsus chesapeaki TaxID=330153 RepID=A0A7J6MC45_PERCH|nr:hypothetical protein FOL47_002795 [Perkinsus chesapeaki]
MSLLQVYHIVTTTALLVHGNINLPFVDGVISSTAIDENPLKFTMDSGDGFTYVVYSDWYEKKYGKGACKSLPSGCYTCPTKCNPYKKEKYTVAFASGMMYEYSLQKGNLVLNGESVGTVEFGLIIGYSPRQAYPNEPPFNIMGLDYGSQQGRYPIHRQLYINGVIDEWAFRICSPGQPHEFKGNLILGVSQGACPARQPVTEIQLRGPSVTAKLDSSLATFGMVSSKGATFSQPVTQVTIVYDTGAHPIVLPRSIFEIVLNKMVELASKDSGQDIHVKTSGVVWYVQKKGFDHLPTLTFTVGTSGGAPFTIRIPLKKYATPCDESWCTLWLYPSPAAGIILGRPFFTTYATGFDLPAGVMQVQEYTA